MDFRNTILLGDIRIRGEELPEKCVNTIVTSPPYWTLRNYSDSPLEIGQEESVEIYVQELADIFDACHRLLRDDGTLWLNLGDTYYKKELVGAPWLVAFELKKRGWRLRSDIIWHKTNAKPSAIATRPTLAHEYLFMFTKKMPRRHTYYYDADAIREPHDSAERKVHYFGTRQGMQENGKHAGDRNLHRGRWDQAFHPMGRNKRTVWSIGLGKNTDAHFAVMPDKLAEPCVLAGAPKGGLVLDPFMGAGTTARVAKAHGRDYLGFEIEQKYIDIAQRRLNLP
jgi:site-specific DNA-methyltransferase (adenine-specific)